MARILIQLYNRPTPRIVPQKCNNEMHVAAAADAAAYVCQLPTANKAGDIFHRSSIAGQDRVMNRGGSLTDLACLSFAFRL